MVILFGGPFRVNSPGHVAEHNRLVEARSITHDGYSNCYTYPPFSVRHEGFEPPTF